MLLLLLAVVAQPTLPLLDPLLGERLGPDAAELLPSGRHLGWQADHLFPSIVNVAPGDGGLSRFDRLELSAHGRSTTQLMLLLNHFDITDPARPGSPLLEVPPKAFDLLGHHSLWTSRPGFYWSFMPPREGEYGLAWSAGYGRPLGGGTWIPRGMMDREPALPYGAARERRVLVGAREVMVQAKANRVRIFAEYVEDDRQFPVTYFDEDGHPLTAAAWRATLMGSHGFDLGSLPLTLVVGWQQLEDDGAGAAYRWPRELVGEESEGALIAQLRTERRVGEWFLNGGVGFGYRSGELVRRGAGPIVKDLEGEWLWMSRPRFDEDLSRYRLDGHLSAHRMYEDEMLVLELRTSYAALSSLASPPSAVIGETYGRASDGSRAAFIDVYDPARRAREWLGTARLEASWLRARGDYVLHVFTGLDYSAVGTKHGIGMGAFGPAVGVAARKFLASSGELFALLRREPDALTSEVSSFLDPDRPSGRRYRWLDDGDGVPDPAEAFELVSRFGNEHRAAEGLRRPSSNQFAFGYKTPVVHNLKAILTGVARFHLQRYTVRYDEETARTFTEVPIGDDVRVPYAEHTPSVAYARTGVVGEEVYELENDHRPDFWLGTELSVHGVDIEPWLFVFSGAAYWNAGAAPFGTFSDRNDPGVVSEASADPNAQINEYGRYDQDRSFTLRLLLGRRFFERLMLSSALRYRDGQPFVKVGVIEGLPQGPVAVMLDPRGRVRHTFHMSLDLRAAYTHVFADEPGCSLTFAVEVFNVLGSGTEQLEDSYSGTTFRRALEMVPGRSAFARLGLVWR